MQGHVGPHWPFILSEKGATGRVLKGTGQSRQTGLEALAKIHGDGLGSGRSGRFCICFEGGRGRIIPREGVRVGKGVLVQELAGCGQRLGAGRPGADVRPADYEMPIAQPRGLLEARVDVGTRRSGDRLGPEV